MMWQQPSGWLAIGEGPTFDEGAQQGHGNAWGVRPKAYPQLVLLVART